MSQNPYQSPSIPATVVGVHSGTREDLKKVAQYQKGIILCIAANLVIVIGMMFLGRSMQMAGMGALVLVMQVAYVAVGFAALVCIILLATKVYNLAIGIVAGLLQFIPCIGLLVLLVVNQKATGVLQQNGIKVGLLGADMSQLE